MRLFPTLDRDGALANKSSLLGGDKVRTKQLEAGRKVPGTWPGPLASVT